MTKNRLRHLAKFLVSSFPFYKYETSKWDQLFANTIAISLNYLNDDGKTN